MTPLTRLIAGSVWSTLVVGGAAVAPLVVSAPAQAQQVRFGRGGPGGMSPEISTRSLDQYAKVLSLDEAQKEAATQLHAGYLESMKQASMEMEESMRSLGDDAEEGDASGMLEKLPEFLRKSGERRGAIQKAFLDDIRTLLTPQQEQAWPRLERLRRREAGMRFGMVSGAGVDMVGLVDSLKLPEDEARTLDETLAQYEADVDRLLVEHEKEMSGLGNDAKDGGVPVDFESIRARMDKSREAGVKVRDLNRQYERRLGALLSESQRPRLADEFKRRAFRQIYRESTPSRWLTAAEKFDDLAPDQREILQQVKEAYDREVTALNERWAAALEQAESEGKAGGFGFLSGGSGESEELKAAKKARRDLDERMNDRIKTALNDKQRERLPKKRPASPESGDFVTAGPGGAVMFQSIEVSDGEDGEEGVHAEVRVIVPR